ncbi:MAG: SRPBCC family protein [Flavobacteriaceae bacterium]
MTHSIEHDLIIQASPAKVFHAITTPEELNQWWTKKCSGRPTMGAPYNLFFTEEYDWWGKVSACEVDQHFEIQMTQSDQDWDPTRFGFRLHTKGNATLVAFYHEGWQENNHHFKFSSWCWALLLKGLKDYLEKGTVIPFEKRS